MYYLRYDTRCYFNVRSKSDVSQLTEPTTDLDSECKFIKNERKYVLGCHLGWMNRRFCIQKGGSQEHISSVLLVIGQLRVQRNVNELIIL